MRIARVIKFEPTAKSTPARRRPGKENVGTLIPFPSSPIIPSPKRGTNHSAWPRLVLCNWRELLATLSRLFRRRHPNASDTKNDNAPSGKSVINDCMIEL